MERKKIVHRLGTPFSSAVEWPVIAQEDQDVILELLCQLLSPLGLHRQSFITPSKGKRKRKRQQKEGNDKDTDGASLIPPVPELARYVDVGLSNISRNLQEMVAQSKADGSPGDVAAPQNGKEGAGAKKAPYSVVFVARSGQSSAFHCHFPQMVAMASKSNPTEEPVRLVGLSRPCEERLSAALGVPRVSSIALRKDAPRADGLVDYVKGRVAPVEVAWLEEARAGQFLETNIEGVPTKIGSKKTT